MTMQASRGAATRAADEAKDHPALAWTARLGFACYGVVYLLIGWLAAQLAFGRPDHSVSGQGALAQLAQQPLGGVLLWVVTVGFAALVVWELCQVVAGHRDQEGLKRLGGRTASAFRALVFAVLGFAAARIAAGGGGSSSSGSSREQGFTAKVLAMPLGPVIVAAVGVGLAIYGVGSIIGGFTDAWRKQIDAEGRTGAAGTLITALARSGYVARGVAFGTVGGLVVWAALTRDPKKSGGLDAALATLRDALAGPYVLVLVAVGLACFGVFNIAKGWFLRDV
ncbi:DUF1206 domain-containing protein [Nocardioides sp. AN3]